MQVSHYIIVKKRSSYSYSSRMTSKIPSLESNEIAVRFVIEIPDAIFIKPALEAKIVIPESAVSRPIISAEVIDNVQEIIKQNMGFEVRLELIGNKEKNDDE